MEVKRYGFGNDGPGFYARTDGAYVLGADFDRVTAERDALQQLLNARDEEEDRLLSELNLRAEERDKYLAWCRDARGEATSLRPDAERYRWMKANVRNGSFGTDTGWIDDDTEQWDCDIDIKRGVLIPEWQQENQA